MFTFTKHAKVHVIETSQVAIIPKLKDQLTLSPHHSILGLLSLFFFLRFFFLLCLAKDVIIAADDMEEHLNFELKKKKNVEWKNKIKSIFIYKLCPLSGIFNSVKT